MKYRSSLSAIAGRETTSQSSLSSTWPTRSSWWRRWVTITMAPVLLSLRRLRRVLSNQVWVALRLVSDKASSAFCGSSTMIRSAPRPVSGPPTEVAMRRPPRDRLEIIDRLPVS
jgi:hypothetical protein